MCSSNKRFTPKFLSTPPLCNILVVVKNSDWFMLDATDDATPADFTKDFRLDCRDGQIGHR